MQSKGFCKLTTKQGVCWEVITINGRAAFQAGDMLVFYNDNVNTYVLVDGMLRIGMSGTMQECLEAVFPAGAHVYSPIFQAVA